MTKRGSWRELFYSIAGLIGILASIAIPVLIVTGVFEVVRGLSPANGLYRVVAQTLAFRRRKWRRVSLDNPCARDGCRGEPAQVLRGILSGRV